MKAIVLGVTFLVALGLSLPMALAHPEDRPTGRDARTFDRALTFEKRYEAGHDNVTLTLAASGIDAHNRTYALEGSGVGVARFRDGENRSGIHGFAKIDLRLYDANGTLVKEGVARVMVIAREGDQGESRWRLVSVYHSMRGMPKLLLGGADATIENGVADLEGAGFALLRVGDPAERLRLRLDADVEIAKA